MSVLVSFVMISVVTYYNIVLDAHLPLIIYAGCCLLWLMFFVVGCVLSQKNRIYSLKMPIAIIMVGFILSLVESYYYLSNYSLGFGIKPSSFIFSLGAVLLLMNNKLEKFYLSHKNMCTRILEYIGGVSFAVYLIHCYVIGWILPHIGVFNNIWLVRWLIAVLISISVIEIMKKIIPHKWLYYIGIYD